MFWADELVAASEGPQVVNDSKTPSGTIHVGALRGVVIHDQIVRALREAQRTVRFLYGIDDLDPMDAQTLAAREGRLEDMGKPLARIAPPAGSDAPSWAEHFARQFIDAFAHVGASPELYRMSALYADGAVDDTIREALDRADAVRRIYREISGSRKADDWLPLQVICPHCGKVGTTVVDGWNGSEVHYRCEPALVAWAQGCGSDGWVSPFGGNAKLPWNLDWVAQWRHFGVTIEACGKDLSTAGGSRDRSDALARQVFGFEPPRNLAYEFVTVRGRKMRSSAGTGAAAHEMASLLPGDVLRFLMLRYRPRHTIEFDPSGETIPRLFDEYDRLALAAAGLPARGELPPDAAAIFRASLVDPAADPAVEGGRYRPAFGHVAFLVQVPGIDVEGRLAADKGAPLDEAERVIVAERVATARRWLEGYAPQSARVEVRRDGLPAEATAISEEQRLFLGGLSQRAEADPPADGEAWQTAIFETAQQGALPAGRAFAALYLAFLGRPNGPRAGWLLASLERDFVLDRLLEAAGWSSAVDAP